MNKYKNPKKGKSTNPLVKILEVQFFKESDIRKWLPFVLYCSLLAFLYISNRLKAEKRQRDLTSLQSELKDIEADYLTIKSDLMFKSKQSEIAKKVAPFGLKELQTPPEIIVRTKK